MGFANILATSFFLIVAGGRVVTKNVDGQIKCQAIPEQSAENIINRGAVFSEVGPTIPFQNNLSSYLNEDSTPITTDQTIDYNDVPGDLAFSWIVDPSFISA